MIKIGVYDRYLSTLGGGERYSCKIAEVLSRQKEYSVDLVTDIYEDLKKVSERLNLDLSRVSLKVFPFLSEEYAKKITSYYDIFINATYLSSLSAYGRKNLYLCYFPTPFDVDFKLIHRFLLLFLRLPAVWLFKFADRLCNGFMKIEVEQGLYEPKRFLLRRGSWSSGKVVLSVKKMKETFRISFKNPASSGLDLMKVSIEIPGNEINITRRNNGSRIIGSDNSRNNNKILYSQNIILKRNIKKVIEIPRRFCNKSYRIIITSNTFIPGVENKTLEDSRKLGVVIYNESRTGFVKKIILKIIGFIPLFLITYPKDLKFLETYNKIISISEYSRNWIRKLWKKDSILLFPPVDIDSFKVRKKEKIILSVGRFFPEHHNKKQLELARVFGELYSTYPEIMSGYTLYLVGGVEQRKSHLEYVEKIKDISKNYPVKIMTNIRWEELIEIFSKASVFWHGAGVGEDEEKHPEKFEHFGITTVEAMASGCISVVINKGGQKEIIKDGEDGFLFESWSELKDITLRVCRGNINVEAVREKAVKNCRKFSSYNFEKNLLSLIRKELKTQK